MFCILECQLIYEYDFGSTTELMLKVVSEFKSNIKTGEVEILARNDPPQIKCSDCDNLATQPDDLVEKFTKKNLRRAYSRELADIISIIRYAAKGGELLTGERRVDKALMKIKSDRSFKDEQNKWLDLIRGHLIENLLMEKEDIETLPIFTREGASWGKLNKVFEGKLENIIHEINEAIAA